MTAQRPDPRVDVAEADLLEQETPVAPLETDEGVAEARSLPAPGTDSADVVDRLEQLQDVADADDEEYPHEV
ncbi:hypothetical protein [Terrabacter terrigena]